MKIQSFLLSILLFGTLSCKKSDPIFVKMDNSEIGISFENTVKNSENFNIFNYRNFYNGGGVAIGDINNDGWQDIFFTANMGANKLYLNKGGRNGEPFKFEDISKKAKIEDEKKWSTGVVMVDINADGWLDIYVCNAGFQKGIGQENSLYINNHDNTFTEKGAEYGLADNGYTTHAAFTDFDLDGDLDVYILNNSFIPVSSLNTSSERERRAEDWNVPEIFRGGGDRFYRNDSQPATEKTPFQPKFTDITKEAGIYSSLIGFGLGVTVGDVNDDNYPDLYICNDFFEKDYLYINQKNGTFKDESETRTTHMSLASMGADMADLNNDGRQEIFVTDMLPKDEYRLKTTTSFENHYIHKLKFQRGLFHQYTQNTLQLGNEDGTFSEIANYSGVQASDWSWGALLFDADNDGKNDIYVCNGIYHDVIDQDFIDFFADEVNQKMALSGKKEQYDNILKHIPSVPIVNNFFHNEGNLKFSDKSEEFGFTDPSFSNGAAYADLDNDGDLDLVVNNVNQQAFVYQNKSSEKETKKNFIKIKLSGDGQNTMAIGSKIEVYCGNEILSKQQNPARGFQSSTEYLLTFGLGDYQKIDSIRVIFPNQKMSVLKNQKVNQTLTFQQKNATILYRGNEFSSNNTIFQVLENSFDAHVENDYEDFYVEKNIPAMLSAEGPKAAIGDVNGDKLDDFYVAGPKFQAGQLYLQNSNGGFTKSIQPVFERFIFSEDTACLFFDADKDGDLDLFVGSGGNESDGGAFELSDRLYFNDGKGNFSMGEGAIPANALNTAVAAAHDFDNDGDLDLFVGSRSTPKQYGMTPPSFLYENDGKGNFKDISSNFGETMFLGMVKDAQWIDIDQDKQKELVVIGDWMSPQVLKISKNNVEKLETGLENYHGLWSSMVSVDIDNDKDLDLVLGNIGENFGLVADENNPMKLYVGDFDNNQLVDKVMSKTVNGNEVTVFLKRELMEQFPFLKNENLKHGDFAKRTISEIFKNGMLDKGQQKTFNYRKSVVAINDGKGNFSISELPSEAQMTCINAIEATDLNNDGLKDLIMGGNSYNFIPQIGRIDACRGVVLMNKKGKFETLNPTKSGFKTVGEVKQISSIKINNRRSVLVLANNQKPLVYQLK